MAGFVGLLEVFPFGGTNLPDKVVLLEVRLPLTLTFVEVKVPEMLILVSNFDDVTVESEGTPTFITSPNRTP